MKKITTVTIALILTLTLCACGKTQPAVPATPSAGESTASESTAPVAGLRDGFDKAVSYVESLIDTGKFVKNLDDEDETYLHCSWSPESEPEKMTVDMDIEVDGQNITVGKTMVKEVEDMGFSVEKGQEVQNPEEILGLTVNKSGKMASMILVPNRTDKAVPVDEAVIKEYVAGSKEMTIPYNYKGLTSDSTLDDALEILGAPNSQVSLSAEAVQTEIVLDYYDEEPENDLFESCQLEVRFIYNAEDNSTVLYGLNLSGSTSGGE